jgi:hypothetical protein
MPERAVNIVNVVKLKDVNVVKAQGFPARLSCFSDIHDIHDIHDFHGIHGLYAIPPFMEMT